MAPHPRLHFGLDIERIEQRRLYGSGCFSEADPAEVEAQPEVVDVSWKPDCEELPRCPKRQRHGFGVTRIRKLQPAAPTDHWNRRLCCERQGEKARLRVGVCGVTPWKLTQFEQPPDAPRRVRCREDLFHVQRAATASQISDLAIGA